MITFYDYLNIAFYFLFIAGIGLYFVRRSKNTSDYFRGGGILPWWVTGASAWMASFSAWTFTGAAGKMYETGLYVLGLYYSSLLGYFVLLFFTCYRFRRMQVVTPLEAVRLRFGPGAQQFLTWLRLPLMLIFGGFGLNAVGVFMAAVFNLPVPTVVIGLGLIVTFLSLLGGSFGVAASDFVQMFLVVTVTVTVTILALNLPDVGGVSGFIANVPAKHFDWSGLARPDFILFWFLALTLNNLIVLNSMDNSAKYLMTRSDSHARKMLIIPIVGTLFGPLLWLVPPMVAAIRHPELGSLFPNLKFPNEAAFLVTASEVLPQGMLGLLICGIFAATLTTMDAGLNQGAGIFVRNFYLPVIHPHASEKRLMVMSKLATAVFGTTIICSGLLVSKFREMQLFDLLNQVGISLNLPIAVALFLAIFFRRTPTWSLWTTAVIGLFCSFAVSMEKFVKPSFIASHPFLQRFVLKPDAVSWIPGWEGPYTPEETTQFYLIATVVTVVGVCTAWFFFTSLFYKNSPPKHRETVDEFFTRLRTPVATRSSEELREDNAIARSIGKLCVIYGSFVALLMLVPNPLRGRLCFVACGGVMIACGLFLQWKYRTQQPPLLAGKAESVS